MEIDKSLYLCLVLICCYSLVFCYNAVYNQLANGAALRRVAMLLLHLSRSSTLAPYPFFWVQLVVYEFRKVVVFIVRDTFRSDSLRTLPVFANGVMADNALIVPVPVSDSFHFAEIQRDGKAEDAVDGLLRVEEIKKEILGDLEESGWALQRIRVEQTGRLWEEDELMIRGDGELLR
jgi:hypothetical protein